MFFLDGKGLPHIFMFLILFKFIGTELFLVFLRFESEVGEFRWFLLKDGRRGGACVCLDETDLSTHLYLNILANSSKWHKLHISPQ